MKKLALSTVVAVAAMAAASPAMAQDAGSEPEVYAGVNAGYHDLTDNPLGKDGGIIYGVYGGVDVPVGESLVVGVEGNFNLGEGAIDSEYGAAAKLGVRVGNGGQLFVRGGYQQIDLDIGELTGDILDETDVDDNGGDYLVGVGAQFKLSESTSLRAVVDTVGFDTTRGTVGIAIHF